MKINNKKDDVNLLLFLSSLLFLVYKTDGNYSDSEKKGYTTKVGIALFATFVVNWISHAIRNFILRVFDLVCRKMFLESRGFLVNVLVIFLFLPSCVCITFLCSIYSLCASNTMYMSLLKNSLLWLTLLQHSKNVTQKEVNILLCNSNDTSSWFSWLHWFYNSHHNAQILNKKYILCFCIQITFNRQYLYFTQNHLATVSWQWL